MTALLHRMIDDMRIRNLSPRTIKSYVYKVRKFAAQFDPSPSELGPEEVRTHLLFLINEGFSRSSIIQSLCALKFLYQITLRRQWRDQVCRSRRRSGVVRPERSVRANEDEIALEGTAVFDAGCFRHLLWLRGLTPAIGEINEHEDDPAWG